MDKQEIIEGNEIIALFMDGVYYEAWGNEAYHSPSPHFYFKDEEEFEKKICIDPKYHSSWDWLMPVVEKVGYSRFFQLSINDYRQNFVNVNQEQGKEGLSVAKTGTEGVLIECVWTAIVQHIKWYNSQNKPS